ncbi:MULTISPECIES: glycoside hydrolase family 97 protein [unclassified Carboxylicivirga]|uniref:glycoside hydrolase family 97 protein n=1 Tax=Carboxylicivirga TaxID=1628153 RepID=UPI003D32BB02
MKTIVYTLAVLLIILGQYGCRSNEAGNKVTSPDQQLTIALELNDGKPFYYVTFKQDTVIYPSQLGFTFKDLPALTGDFTILSTKIAEHQLSWEQPWGENKTVQNHYQELVVCLQETSEHKRFMNLYFRAYNDGVAFRYELPEQNSLSDFVIMDELTQFDVSGNPDTWWIWADYNTYEKLYQKTSMEEASWVATPVTMKGENNVHISIHEAALTDYAGMTLKQKEKGIYEAELVPWANGDKVRGSVPMKTPWRTIQISDNAAGLVQSNLIVNLNEPSRIDDTSWIKPMKYIGIWWGMHLGTETWYPGPRHGATTENALAHIDFAAAKQIEGLVIEGWNDGWENWGAKDAFDHVTPARDFDLEKVAAYAQEKGVKLIGHHETGGDIESYEKYMEAAYKMCHDLGIHAVKTGYAGGIYPRGEHHHGQFMVRHYRKVVELAAKYEIMLDVHEPIKPTGIRRTWPNMMTREGVRGMEWNAWSDGNPPSHTVIIPFTRGLAGPTDYTPGTFDLLFANAGKREKWNADDISMTRTHTTLARQLANFVILYSPLQMASDLPKNYEGHPAFQFIADYEADCDESRVLNGEIGQYITLARRSGEEWFLGSATNEEARTLTVKLDFLAPGTSYLAQVYTDADDAHWKTNPQAYVIEEDEVTSETVLILKLAAGGGQAIRFVRK